MTTSIETQNKNQIDEIIERVRKTLQSLLYYILPTLTAKNLIDKLTNNKTTTAQVEVVQEETEIDLGNVKNTIGDIVSNLGLSEEEAGKLKYQLLQVYQRHIESRRSINYAFNEVIEACNRFLKNRAQKLDNKAQLLESKNNSDQPKERVDNKINYIIKKLNDPETSENNLQTIDALKKIQNNLPENNSILEDISSTLTDVKNMKDLIDAIYHIETTIIKYKSAKNIELWAVEINNENGEEKFVDRMKKKLKSMKPRRLQKIEECYSQINPKKLSNDEQKALNIFLNTINSVKNNKTNKNL